MKKQILIMMAALCLSSALNASENTKKDQWFRPAFKKKLKRVKSVGLRSLIPLNLKRNSNKKLIFIDWQKLYWGNLVDLIYSPDEAYDSNLQGEAKAEQNGSLSFDTQESLALAKELRQELKGFAKHYGFQIVWRKKSSKVVDGTRAFLEYWDRGLSQGDQDKIMPFAELCSLSVKQESPEETKPKKASPQDPLLRNIYFLNPLFEKGA